jgi:hypothetical protein
VPSGASKPAVPGFGCLNELSCPLRRPKRPRLRPRRPARSQARIPRVARTSERMG